MVSSEIRGEILASSDIAFVTILNGVLLDVMPAITTSFSLATLSQIGEKERKQGMLAELIQFGFTHSGYSFQEKVRLYRERQGCEVDEERALEVYNYLRSSLLKDAVPVAGIEFLLVQLQQRGILTFVTSVVPHLELQAQLAAVAGGAFVPLLTEALGEQDGYKKLMGHLSLIKKHHPKVKRFYLLFDAPYEIRLGRQARSLYRVRNAGVVYPLRHDVVTSLVRRGEELLTVPQHEALDQLLLPSAEEQKLALEGEGAEMIIVHEGKESLSSVLRDVELF